MNEEVKTIITNYDRAWNILIEKCGMTRDIPLLLIILIYGWWKCEIGKAMALKMLQTLVSITMVWKAIGNLYLRKTKVECVASTWLLISKISYIYNVSLITSTVVVWNSS